jgi:hypothetical protein
MNQIDVVIPTMWRYDKFIDILKQYVTIDVIRKIIIIDNDYKKRPKDTVLNNSKIEMVNYGRNIYVSRAWNEGFYRAKTDVFAILNDDIDVEADVFKDIVHTDFSSIDIIGVHLQGTSDNYNIGEHKDKKDVLFKLDVNKQEPIGGQSYAFGVCLFIKKSWYPVLPSLYQLWFNDDYLVQQANNIYCLKTSRIKGEISKTHVSLKNNIDIQNRLYLDCLNVYNFNHMKNGKNWDLVKQTIGRSKSSKTQSIFESEYKKAKLVPSDINENLPVLYNLAKTVNHITEFGVRTGVSTRAFLNTDAELVSYDIYIDETVQQLFNFANQENKKAQYIKADTLSLVIEETDLLFIDTLHTYKQLKQELYLHGNKSRKYIVFHDTYTFGLIGEDKIDKQGLLSAIIEFIINNPHWKFKIYKTNNNGMTVLERTTDVKI